MKHLIFILSLFFTVTYSNAQNSNQSEFEHQVITVNGKDFKGDIDSYLGGKINFQRGQAGVDGRSIPIQMVQKIIGSMPDSRIRRILKDNPEVEFIEKSRTTSELRDIMQDGPIITSPNEFNDRISSGYYLQRAGRKYLFGVGATVVGTGLTVISLGNEDYELATIGSAVTLIGAIVSITGHFDLIKAGKAYNREQITLSPASEGIGLAINF